MFKRNNKKHNNSNKDKSVKNPKPKKQKLTKEEKRELKEKRKKFKKKKYQYEIEGGIGGDKAPSTKRDVKTLYIFWLGIFLCGTGLIAFIFFHNAWSNHLKNNTSELGKVLKFQKSDDAEIKFNEVWTDKNRQVTVVKFGYSDASRKKLSTDGTDYKIYMKPKGKRPEVKISYGILNLEGDGYLFIKGKLNDQPYNMALENTLALVSSSLTHSSSVSSSSSNDNDESLESIISSSNNDGSDTNIFSNKDSKEDDTKEDIVKFTINPYSDTTKVYNGSFLNSSGEIDYSKVVSQTSIEAAIKRKEKEIEPHRNQLEKLEKSKPKYEDKVKQEKKAKAKDKSKKKDEDKDKSSKVDKVSENERLLEETEKSIEEEKNTISNLESELDNIKQARFDKTSFGDMQTKSTIY